MFCNSKLHSIISCPRLHSEGAKHGAEGGKSGEARIGLTLVRRDFNLSYFVTYIGTPTGYQIFANHMRIKLLLPSGVCDLMHTIRPLTCHLSSSKQGQPPTVFAKFDEIYSTVVVVKYFDPSLMVSTQLQIMKISSLQSALSFIKVSVLHLNFVTKKMA